MTTEAELGQSCLPRQPGCWRIDHRENRSSSEKHCCLGLDIVFSDLDLFLETFFSEQHAKLWVQRSLFPRLPLQYILSGVTGGKQLCTHKGHSKHPGSVPSVTNGC